MTEPYGVHADRLDSSRGPWRPVLVSLILGLVLGAPLGGLYSTSKVASYQATTALSVLPDSLVNTEEGTNAPTVDSTSFIQSQLVVLNGSQLADQVQKKLALGERPTVSSTQVGQSYVVQVAATAGTRSQALSIASTAASLYATQRANALTASIKSSAASIKTQLANVQASLTAAQANTPITNGLTPSETALQTEYERLLSIQSGLNLALPQVNRVVAVLSPASVSPAALSATAKYAVGGALLGAIIALALLVLARRTIPRVRSVGDIAGLGVALLLPVMPRRPGRSRRGAAAWRSSSARLLAARLTGHGAGPAEPVVVVGATRGVGASYVAASLAAGLVDRGPVLLVLASEMTYGPNGRLLTHSVEGGAALPAQTPSGLAEVIRRAVHSEVNGLWLLPCSVDDPALAGPPSVRSARLNEILDRATQAGWLAVVDAPALADSDLALDCTGVSALVVGRGLTRPTEIASSAELFESHGGQLSGVIVNDPPRRLPLNRRSGRDSGPPNSPIPSVHDVKPTPTAMGSDQADDGRRREGTRRAAGSERASRTQRVAEEQYSNDVVPFPPDPAR